VTALSELAREAPIDVVVTTGSMAPGIVAGARVSVRGQTGYRRGDVLVFANSVGDLVAHRLLGRRRLRGAVHFVTRGDAAPRADGLVPTERVVGRVVGGECASRVADVPALDRLRAGWRFLTYLGSRLGARLAFGRGEAAT
jgi:signal peptidase I